jgi:hypothetical protein
MKIRLFKPKTPSNTKISITVKLFNSPASFRLKGNNLDNHGSPTCGQRYNKHMLPERQNDCRCIDKYLRRQKEPNRIEIRYW